jgi:hypothetical protein
MSGDDNGLHHVTPPVSRLIEFLIYFFPYLAGWEAVRYLLVADADLVAARLIVTDPAALHRRKHSWRRSGWPRISLVKRISLPADLGEART